MVLRNTGRSRIQWKANIKRFCDVWMCASNRSEKTICAYRSDLRQFLRQLPTTVGPRGVHRSAIERWVAKLQKQEYAASSIRRKLASLRAFYAYLITTGGIGSSPLADLRIRLGAMKRLTRVVPRYDLRALVVASDRLATQHRCAGLNSRQREIRLRNSLLVRVLCVTGIRVGELVALNVSDVRQRERTLIITGKGSRERLAYIADSRTAKLLDRYLVARGIHIDPEIDALFPNISGNRISTENVRQILRTLGRSVNLSLRVTPHMLRHTAATTLLENGADLRIVQEFLGHDSIRSTERYTHVAPVHLRRVLRRTNPLKHVA